MELALRLLLGGLGIEKLVKTLEKPHVSHKITKKKTKHVEVKINLGKHKG